MRLAYKILLCVILFVGCKTSKTDNTSQCNENTFFKTEFYKNIKQVEEYVMGNGDRLKFKNSLNFLSKYVKVSNDKMLNYNNSYNSLDDFKNDKKSWSDWYDKNKCKNLQLK